ncbi:hypothetical protein NG796_23250 [Laspinema sp. A4]|uniref:P-loop NTPase fold protein n=1 Tax=Laspinema sp. D2d TaxID=2953686 RepID=UPI0021BB7873|nr:P-loop NTPase fold protein [Laspinema sp. D2d]MCT7986194.1 hypothetical protein [Laspinema sp. D2d]
MPENAGQKQAITDFLLQVKKGLKLVEEIWIDREVKRPGSEGPLCNQAESLSGYPISTITELIEDDLNFCFQHQNFIFRMIAADAGSGKTAILNYIQQRLEANHSDTGRIIIPIYTNLNNLLTSFSSQGFSRQFYLHLISEVFKIALIETLEPRFKQSAARSLEELFPEELNLVNLIVTSKKSGAVKTKLDKLLIESGCDLLETFLEIVQHFKNQGFYLFFLIDELDSLYQSERSKDAVNTFRHLINQIEDDYQGKLPLGLYISGLSDDVQKFIKENPALKSRVYPGEIRLVRFRNQECEEIRAKIDNRLYSAYQGYKDFPEFKKEVQSIDLKAGTDFNSLREFCQRYGSEVLQIHQKYFKHHDKSFNQFEFQSRIKLEELCIQKWSQQLGNAPSPISGPFNYQGHQQWKRFSGKQGYKLIIAQTTTNLEGHNFDGYAELRHNGDVIAKAFGEAKNYELLTSHFTTFKAWLADVRFYGKKSPPDLAYLFAPGCPNLLELKIKNTEIVFYPLPKEPEMQSQNSGDKSKVLKPLEPGITNNLTHIESVVLVPSHPQVIATDPETAKEINSVDVTPTEVESTPKIPETLIKKSGININTASLDDLIQAFKGSGMRKNTIEKISQRRPKFLYKNLDDLLQGLGSTNNVKNKLQDKLDSGEIYF